jgi:hypothetical protein
MEILQKYEEVDGKIDVQEYVFGDEKRERNVRLRF